MLTLSTALSYQIDSKNSLEVVYKKQLKDSLVNSKMEVFNEISKTTVFSKIISSVISELSNFDGKNGQIDHHFPV